MKATIKKVTWIKEIINFSKDSELYDKIIMSIAPSIYGLREIKEAIMDPEEGMVVRINKMQTERQQELLFQRETKEQMEADKILESEAKKTRNWQLVMIICVLVIVGGKEVIPYLLKLLAFFP